MASYKLNMATISGCPASADLAAAMEEFGLPDTEAFGVLNASATRDAAFGTIVHKTQQSVQRLDPKTREVTAAVVEKVSVYPFTVRPGDELLEIYAGPAGSIEQVGVFFAGCLAFPTVTEAIELDVADTVDKLAKRTERFQLRGIRVSEYAHNSYMSGPYAPKFLDSEHGKTFMGEYVDYVTAAKVRFAGQAGRINVSLSPKACFSFSCDEEDVSVARGILRRLL